MLELPIVLPIESQYHVYSLLRNYGLTNNGGVVHYPPAPGNGEANQRLLINRQATTRKPVNAVGFSLARSLRRPAPLAVGGNRTHVIRLMRPS